MKSTYPIVFVLVSMPIAAYCDPSAEFDAFLYRLEKSITCEASAQPDWGSNCHLRFDGLVIELANMRQSKFSNIFVRALGKGQYVLPRGARCLEVFYSPASGPAKLGILAPSFLLHGSGEVGDPHDTRFRDACVSDRLT